MNANDLQNKSVEELNTELHSLLREQFNLRMQRGTGQLTKPHLIGQVRKNIARVKTFINQKQMQES